MTMTPMTSPAGTALGRSASRVRAADPAFLIAAALFLAVVIAEAAFIALAAPSIPDIGALYVTAT